MVGPLSNTWVAAFLFVERKEQFKKDRPNF